MAEAPAWLLDRLGQAGAKRSDEEWISIAREGVGEGMRNTAVASVAGLLFRRIKHPHLARELTLAWHDARCRPALPDNEIARTMESIARLELQRRERFAR